MSYKLLNQDVINRDLLFGELWNISVDGMLITDEEGEILLVNEACCKILNLKEDDLYGKNFTIALQLPDQENETEQFKNLVRNELTKHQSEKEITLRNGKKLWLEFSDTNLILPDQKKLTLSVFKDVTERKKAELELKESKDKYKMLFNNANDAVFVTQLSEGKSYGDFIEVNDIACKRLGYTKEEFLKLSPSAIISQQSINNFNMNMEKLLSDNHVMFEIVYKAKDKKLTPVEVSSHLFIFNNKLTVLSIARDITERKKAEMKLEKSSKHLRNFALRLQNIREEERSMIAREIHDELGQALTALKIHITLLSNKLPAEKSELSDRASVSLKMIDDIVESVQKISMKLHPHILDELGLTAAIEWQAKEFEHLTKIKCWLIIPSDEIRLNKSKSIAVFRILQEALTNAARHSEADTIFIKLNLSKGNLVLEVKDNGIGILPERLTDFRSLGILGMKERAMAFGGELNIESLYGKGTTLKLVMPED